MNRFLLLYLFLSFSFSLSGQNLPILWTDVDEGLTKNTEQERVIFPEKYRSLQLNEQFLKELLSETPKKYTSDYKNKAQVIEIPLPDGRYETFWVWKSPVMAKGLAMKFPDIQTFAGIGVNDETLLLKMDITSKGFHAMVLNSEGTYFVDPLFKENTAYYQSYYKTDFKVDEQFLCEVEGKENSSIEKTNGFNPIGEELRTYRLAVATTGEYTQFHGGTVQGALSAIASTMHRVNGLYERDLALRMLLVDSNHLIIFTDPNTDPYNGGSGTIMNKNQQVVDDSIGTANYDMGHVMDTGSGGIARLGAICSTSKKAKGYTGLSTPVGDPFDIDYVAHEMGHQWGANHTFNGNVGSCDGNRASGTAFEPGSGTTIMGYAGICGNQNTAFNSDDHFHVASFDEIVQYSVFGNGNNCAEITPTGNTPPNVYAGEGGHIIPISTPFELIASASDVESDLLFYCWEQFDLGPSGHPNDPSEGAPLFRSFSPTRDSVRVFPQIADIVNNTNTIGEILSSYSRNLTFRVTVRDNFSQGGGVDWDEMSMVVTDEAGPFQVTSQNDETIWTAGAFQRIEWDIANTDQAPVNAAQVNIFLSVDGGYTYPFQLKENTPNDGSELILVPDTISTQVRVKVKAADNVFFDINDQDISIELPTEADFSVAPDVATQLVCAPEETSYTIFTTSILNFADSLEFAVSGVPEGALASFSSNLVIPGDAIQLNIGGTNEAVAGMYDLTISASSTLGIQSFDIQLQIFSGVPEGFIPIVPIDGDRGVSIMPEFSWEQNVNSTQYLFQLATDDEFENILFEEDGIEGNSTTSAVELNDSTYYFWRIKGFNEGCGWGEFSPTFSFETEILTCEIFSAVDSLLGEFPNLSFFITSLEIEEDFPIRDINVVNLKGTHSNLGSLKFQLRQTSSNTIITLLPRKCNGTEDFHVNFDDEATGNSLPCPYDNGETYKPEQSLDAFSGMSMQGAWKLIIQDVQALANEGNLESWGLEICYPKPIINSTKNEYSLYTKMILYPNPVSDQLTLHFQLQEKINGSFRIMNTQGQQLEYHNLGQLQKGSHNFLYSTNNLSSGMYYIQLLDANSRILGSKKFVKLP